MKGLYTSYYTNIVVFYQTDVNDSEKIKRQEASFTIIFHFTFTRHTHKASIIKGRMHVLVCAAVAVLQRGQAQKAGANARGAPRICAAGVPAHPSTKIFRRYFPKKYSSIRQELAALFVPFYKIFLKNVLPCGIVWTYLGNGSK